MITVAACGGQDEHPPHQADAAVDAAVDAEEWIEPPPLIIDYRDAYRALEILVDLERRLPGRVVNGRFPTGIVAATPAATCCGAGGVTTCVPDPTAWVGMWEELGFRIESPHKFVYDAQSVDGTSLVIHAVGDLDCDGWTTTISLSCTLPNDVVTCQLTLPHKLE